MWKTIRRWTVESIVWDVFKDNIWPWIWANLKTGLATIMGIITSMVGRAGDIEPFWIIVGVTMVVAATIWAVNGLQQRGMGLGQRVPSVPSVPSSEPDSQNADWIRYFERFFNIELNTVSFRHLWNDAGTKPNGEPVILFQLVVRNNTPLQLTITGIQGQATVDGDHCVLPAKWQTGGSMHLGAWAYAIPDIQQPLLTDKGKELLGKMETNETIRISLGSIHFLVEDRDGSMPNRPMTVPVSFEIDPSGLSVEQPSPSKQPMTLKKP